MDKIIKTTGIIIRSASYKENDRMLTLFSREYGRLDVASRGCKKNSSPLFAASSLFTYGHYQLYNRNGRLSLMQAEVLHNFYALSKHLEAFAAAQFMAGVCGAMAAPMENQSGLFALLIHLLTNMESNVLDPSAALLVFALKASDIHGVRPNLYSCVRCGRPETDGFSLREGGLVCRPCGGRDSGFPLSDDQISLLRMILATKNKDIPGLSYPADKTLLRLMVRYLLLHTGIRESQAEFLQKIHVL